MGKKVGKNTLRIEVLSEVEVWDFIDFVHRHGCQDGVSLTYQTRDALFDIERRMKEEYIFDPKIYERYVNGTFHYLLKVSHILKMRAHPVTRKLSVDVPQQCDLDDVNAIEVLRFSSNERSNFGRFDKPAFVDYERG